MNISFSKLGEGECEQCVEHSFHKTRNACHEGHKKIVSSAIASMVNDIECKLDGCQICSDMEIHLRNADIARSEHKNDTNRYKPAKGEVMAAVEMQKVVMFASNARGKEGHLYQASYCIPHDIRSFRWT